MRRSPGLVGLTVAASVLVVVACSGDGDTSPSTASVVPVATTTSAAPTTSDTPVTSRTTVMPAMPSTTTAETTTAEPTTTVSETSAPSTTLPDGDGVPPRVTFPDDPDKQAVVAAAYAFFDAARAAQADPGNESLRAALADTMTEPIAGRLVQFLDQLVASNERIIANPDQPTYLDIFAPTVSAVDGSGTFDACAVDADVRITGPAGAETILDDDLVSGVQTYSLTRSGAVWRVRDFTIYETWANQVGCG